MKMFKVMVMLFIAAAPAATATTFEKHAKLSSSLRLPSSLVKEAIEFDCSAAKSEIELSTPLETIRVIGKNCPRDIIVVQSQYKQKLHSFSSAEEGAVTSEFAYLRKGENQFEINAGKKFIRLKVFRY